MFSYKMLKIATFLMVFSFGYFCGECLPAKYKRDSEKNLFLWLRNILLILSMGMFVWLLCSKERFHWNFDIATGEPVDHYSTYGRCMAYTVVALLSNLGGMIVAYVRNNKKKNPKGERTI